MFVRVFDKVKQRYYKSMVYCGINIGFYRQYVVINPCTGCFELVDYLDKSGGEPTPLVEIIQDDHDEWVCYENAMLLKYKAYCKKHRREMKLNFLWGYRDVCEDFDFLTAILERGSVPIPGSGIRIRPLPDTETWNYIRSQEDADAFMKAFAGFHDSTLDRLVYEEGPDATKVTATFDNSCWYGIAQLCFEGILAVNIRPPRENYSREIFEATLLVRDETIFWADGYLEKEDLTWEGSYIKALNLKWRKIG